MQWLAGLKCVIEDAEKAPDWGPSCLWRHAEPEPRRMYERGQAEPFPSLKMNVRSARERLFPAGRNVAELRQKIDAGKLSR